MLQKVVETDYEFFTTTLSAWEAMLDDCARAQQSIYFEQYILSNDDWGNRFLNLFLEKAKQGVKVTLVFDFIGSLDIFKSPIIKDIRKYGGHVRFYRPLSLKHLFRPHKWFPRTHLKCMIIDAQTGYLGSGCVAKRMEDWRDTYMRFNGALVKEMMREFRIDPIPSTALQSNGTWENDGFDFQLNKPRLFSNPVYKDLLKHIHQAENHICIVTPYFIAPRKLAADLLKAARKGVKVTVMSSRETDVLLADLAARSDYLKYINNNIDIYLYQPAILHAKYAIVDGRWATMGSTNIDYLSLHQNRESNVAMTNMQAISELQQHFDIDLKDCMKVDEAYCRERPWLEKIAGTGAKLLKKML